MIMIAVQVPAAQSQRYGRWLDGNAKIGTYSVSPMACLSTGRLDQVKRAFPTMPYPVLPRSTGSLHAY